VIIWEKAVTHPQKWNENWETPAWWVLQSSAIAVGVWVPSAAPSSFLLTVKKRREEKRRDPYSLSLPTSDQNSSTLDASRITTTLHFSLSSLLLSTLFFLSKLI